MLLDPINSITSVEFYKKVAQQSLGRSAVYLLYLSFLFSTAASVALKINGGPLIDETFSWLEASMPTLTVFNGKITSAHKGPTTVRHPSITEIAVTVDTTRTEPVTAEMLEEKKVFAYVTADALYMKKGPGKIETHDLSKTAAAPGDKPIVIDAAFYRKASSLVSRLIYPVSMVLTFAAFLVWKTVSTGLYSLMALIINSMAGANLDYKSLLNVTLYAQTLVITLQAIFLFMPLSMPAGGMISTLLTGVYLWLAIHRNAPAPAEA